MSDFMQWLYAHYIQPELEAAPKERYEMWLSEMEWELVPHCREAYEKALEFTAIHAFCLGFRTGQGLRGPSGG